MRIGCFLNILWVCVMVNVQAQTSDSLKTRTLCPVEITGNLNETKHRHFSPIEIIHADFLHSYFSGGFIQSIEKLPGIHSMNIGSGFAKPNIRGMSFQRISVVRNGIKQEGQQWGADHGLEVDAWDVNDVHIHKGPASLLYGSDAMGGVLEILPPQRPQTNQWFVESISLAKSVNAALGTSLLLGVKQNAWLHQIRFTEQHFGDYYVNKDTLVYLTQKLPIYHQRLKNTAGFDRDISWFTSFHQGRYQSHYALSNVFQKVGFFPGAHGAPDIDRVQDDGSRYNIDLPFSWVNHLSFCSQQQYLFDWGWFRWNGGYQYNHREEWSAFHTHYRQPPPKKNSEQEFIFRLHTLSSNLKVSYTNLTSSAHTFGWDIQIQQNNIDGYAFLLPQYSRESSGFFWLGTWDYSDHLKFQSGLRYDYGRIHIQPYWDPYLAIFLRAQGYDEATVERNRIRSHNVKRSFQDYSASFGVVWDAFAHTVSCNVGHSFRLPSANELAANGVHHGSFRHEEGNPNLNSERGWGIDLNYTYETADLLFSLTPFGHWFSNYIYLQPTGEWSVLPHTGLLYQYTQTEALSGGMEMRLFYPFMEKYSYELIGESVYTYNLKELISLSYTPPTKFAQTLKWTHRNHELYLEHKWICAQDRVARNENPSPGVHLFNIGAKFSIPMGKIRIELFCSVQNVLDTPYFNHLSFYKQIELPEQGRNYQLIIKIPFKKSLK